MFHYTYTLDTGAAGGVSSDKVNQVAARSRLAFRTTATLTSASDVNVQISFEDGAVLQGLRGIHRVDDTGAAELVAGAVTSAAKHAAQSREVKGGGD